MYKRINPGWLKHWDFEILDIVAMEIAFILAYIIRHWDVFPYLPALYIRLAIMLAVLDLVVILFTNNYKSILQRNKTQELVAVVQHATIVQLLLLVYEYTIQETDAFSRTVFFLSWGLAVIFCLFGRLVLKRTVRARLTAEKNQSHMLVLAENGHVGQVIEKLYQKTWRGYRVTVVAVPGDEFTEELPLKSDVPVLCGKEAILEYVRQNVVDEVYIDTYGSQEELNTQIDLFLGMGITVHVGMGFLPDDLPNQLMERMGEAYVVTAAVKTATGWQIALKRALDIVGGLIGVILTGIIYIFVAPAIKIASPGPAFFTQTRIGKNGRPFKMYKFRSMHMDAEERLAEVMDQNEIDGLMFKLENDPRIIGSEKGPGKGIGNFIRKTSLDEFPQFLNVLKGDMSLVGTRPPTVNEYEQYALHHKIRLSMKPGITGLWQVSGRSDIKNFEKVVEMDAAYIENWTLILDIKILFQTLGVVFTGKGSK